MATGSGTFYAAAGGTSALRLVAILGILAAETFLCRAWISVNLTTVGFLYLITILLVAAAWGLREALVGSVVATLCYNFFFFPPVGTLTIEDPLNWIALLAFLTTSVIASQLSERARKRSEDALSRQSDMERLYSLSRAILLADPTEPVARQIAYETARIYDLEAVVLYDRTTDEIHRGGPGEAPELERRMTEASVSGTVFRDEAARGIVVPVQLGGRPVGSLALVGKAFSDTALQALANLVSLGIEKSHSQEAASRAEAARQSEEFKSTLLDAIAHEFKTPLTAIKAATTAILSDSVTGAGEQRELLSMVDSSADRLGALVTDAIHLARIEAREMRLDLEAQPVNGIVDTALADMKSVLEGRAVEIAIPPDLSPALVDAELVELVLRHLIDNAVKYSPAGSPITVAASNRNNQVALAIRNEGEGIAEPDRARIFEKFYRGANWRQRVPGTGMGLAIAREVLAAHGGEIRVESAPGRGAAFTLLLPAAKTAVPA